MLTIEVIRSLQLTRTTIVSLLPDPELRTAITGCYVRVLLELEGGTEDYRVGRVRDTSIGASYAGFTNDRSVSTTTYLVLDLPGHLQCINGSSFQLNSISNSSISQNELEDWLRSPDMQQPSLEQVSAKLAMLRPILARAAANRQAPQTAVPPPQFPQSAVPHGTVVGPNVTALPPSVVAPVRRPLKEEIEEVVTPEIVERQVMDELREKHQVFPKDCIGHKLSYLRTLERDLVEYLESVRASMKSGRSNCVVCLDRPPTVIMLPCKHKVVCLLCASQVRNCPCCREDVVELFEPEDIS